MAKPTAPFLPPTCMLCDAARLGLPCYARAEGVARYCTLIAIGRDDYRRLVLSRSGGTPRAEPSVAIGIGATNGRPKGPPIDRPGPGKPGKIAAPTAGLISTVPPASGAILITGGIGDFLVLDSWMAPEFRAGLSHLHWAAPESTALRALVDANPAWPEVEHVVDWTEFGPQRRAFYTLAELAGLVEADALAGVEDWTIARVFPEIMAGQRRFYGSSFLRPKLADISRFGLPSQEGREGGAGASGIVSGYTVICPATTSTHRLDRVFSREEWAWTLERLAADRRKGVVIGTGDDFVPSAPGRLVNLVNRTTIAEAAEIVKGAAGYIGVDACWSVLAAQVLPASAIHIRSTVGHIYRYARTYYAPHAAFPFLRRSLNPTSVLGGAAWEPLDGELLIDRELGVVVPAVPVDPVPYDLNYWIKYQGYGSSEIGRRLNDFRVSLVARHVGADAPILDIGIGCGTFLERWAGPTWGYDVNPVGVAWLEETSRWCDPYLGGWPNVAAVCMFDVIEHMQDPQYLLDRVPAGVVVVVSLPVFPELTAEAIKASRHFRPGEHLWMTNQDGLIRYFDRLGFAHRETRWDETEIGRSSIMTAVFKKRKAKARAPLGSRIAPPPGGG